MTQLSRNSAYERVAIVGAGAWGTALAAVAARRGRQVTLWAREPDVAAAINAEHTNPLFLPGIELPPGIAAVSDVKAVASAELLLMVVPAQFVRDTLTALKPHVARDAAVVLCAKGIEQKTGKVMSEVLHETMPDAVPAVLSGPSFARDVAQGLPTALTLACTDESVSQRFVATLHTPIFRIYLSDDLIGAELGGAVKNVFAIACGIVDGRKLGDSARAALIARGFAELMRLAVAMGARPETLSGLSGLGDLILTCTSRQSRNMSLGVALGEGQHLNDILASRTSVAEGVHTVRAVVDLARRHHVDMPVCQAVAGILEQKVSVDDAIEHLLARPPSDEF